MRGVSHTTLTTRPASYLDSAVAQVRPARTTGQGDHVVPLPLLVCAPRAITTAADRLPLFAANRAGPIGIAGASGMGLDTWHDPCCGKHRDRARRFTRRPGRIPPGVARQPPLESVKNFLVTLVSVKRVDRPGSTVWDAAATVVASRQLPSGRMGPLGAIGGGTIAPPPAHARRTPHFWQLRVPNTL